MFPITTHKVRSNGDETHAGAAFKEAMKLTDGLEKIGRSGLYSSAYSNENTPFAVKVGRMIDIGYLAYLKVIRELGIDNPYLPRILDVNFFVLEEDPYHHSSYFVVRMEKLRKGEYEHPWSMEGDSEFAQKCRFIRKLANKEPGEGQLTPEIEEVVALLHLAFERANAKDRNPTFDLHCANFLLRGEQLVITDPLA